MKGKLNYVLIGAGVFIMIVAAYFFIKGKMSTDMPYREVKVFTGNLEVNVLATGTVLPANRLEIKPPIAGRVEKVLIKEGEVVKKGQILIWMSSTERAAMLDAARSQGREELKKWEELYRPTPVMAPIDGTIILRSVESGQTFTNTESVLVMSDRLTVKAQVDETDVASIKLGLEAKVVLDAYSDKQIAADVVQIAFEAKTVNNVTTYTIDVLPRETPDFMRAGMTANITFRTDFKENVLLVPNEAIKNTDNVKSVQVRSSNGGQEERMIKTGISDGKHTQVLEGLSDGEVILVVQYTSSDRNTKNSNPFSPIPGRGKHK